MGGSKEIFLQIMYMAPDAAWRDTAPTESSVRRRSTGLRNMSRASALFASARSASMADVISLISSSTVSGYGRSQTRDLRARSVWFMSKNHLGDSGMKSKPIDRMPGTM